MEWWNDIKQLSRVYLTSSEQMDRTGPVPAAVRAAGYRSEEEEEEEEDGSSVEEDEEEYEEAEDQAAANTQQNATAIPVGASATAGGAPTAADTSAEEEIPAYSGTSKGSAVEIGPNGK